MNQISEKKNGVIRAAVVVVAVGLAVAMSACNTVSGVGKDIQEASDNVKDAIEN